MKKITVLILFLICLISLTIGVNSFTLENRIITLSSLFIDDNIVNDSSLNQPARPVLLDFSRVMELLSNQGTVSGNADHLPPPATPPSPPEVD